MTPTIQTKPILRIQVIDDDPDVRDAYCYHVEDLNLRPIIEHGPLTDLQTTLQSIRTRSDAAICDFQLQKRQYAAFDGARIVSGLYKLSHPAILCTRWEKAHIDEIRQYRRNIPVLIRPDELEPSSIEWGLQVCLAELNGNFLASRKPWRTLVRVVDIDENGKYIYIIIPGWDRNQGVKVFLEHLPENVKGKIQQGEEIFHARVNIGAEEQEDIYVHGWEEE